MKTLHMKTKLIVSNKPQVYRIDGNKSGSKCTLTGPVNEDFPDGIYTTGAFGDCMDWWIFNIYRNG